MNGNIKRIREFVKKDIGLYPLIFSLIISLKPLGLHLGPIDLISYALYILTSLIILSKSPVFDKLSLCFVVYLVLTILIDRPNEIFHSWERLGLFTSLFICVSPFISSRFAHRFRKGVFVTILFSCTLISLVSFVCYFLGINMMRSMFTGENLEYLTNTAGTFGGITSQSMLLGPISGVGVIAGIYFVRKKSIKLLWLIPVACMASVLFSASRSSLIATILGVVFFFLYYTRQRYKNLKPIITILIISAFSYPIWDTYFERVNAKNKGLIQSGLNLDSRQRKWEIRIQEWKENPLTGIGFAAVSYRDNYSSKGVIEPGSSWLGVLSMTGLIGFVLFLSIYVRALRKSLFTHTPHGALLGGILALLGVHMLAEGHVFSAGSFLCFLVWLTIGCATDGVGRLQAKSDGK